MPFREANLDTNWKLRFILEANLIHVLKSVCRQFYKNGECSQPNAKQKLMPQSNFGTKLMTILDHSSTKVNRKRIRGLPFSYNCVALGAQNAPRALPQGGKSVVVLVKMAQ